MRPDAQGVSKETWVKFQLSQFKELARVVPPDQFQSELNTAINAYRKMLKVFESSPGNTGEKPKQEEKTSKPEADDEKKTKTVKRKNWLPLESDPGLVNNYMAKLGVDAKEWEFHDVFELNPQGMMHIPTPVLALMLLFPISEASEKARVEEQKTLEEAKTKAPEGVYHIKQTVGNACGTIGVMHAVLNNTNKIKLKETTFLAKFLASTKNMDASARAKALEESKDLEVEHQVVARAGKTKANAREFANLHFISFVAVNDVLYELDGRKSQPISHGPTSRAKFVDDALKVVNKFVAFSPKDRRFNVIVLAPKRKVWSAPQGSGAASSGAAPDEARQKETIDILVGMGIPADKAKEALLQTGWSANRAIEFYFTNM
uniref:Ubiquitin carboxyl-terminal hydrolase n=1 Tax=Norrisiella sphaerica TaxID=552664 RepID=A0A7S2VUH0_9EUKA|mmetsp:Transcript_148/g.198  ORF Transcript_148/g.198 Transcript_148/m.198 type:complete len:375 (+) Transcript_148:3-1127(+)